MTLDIVSFAFLCFVFCDFGVFVLCFCLTFFSHAAEPILNANTIQPNLDVFESRNLYRFISKMHFSFEFELEHDQSNLCQQEQQQQEQEQEEQQASKAQQGKAKMLPSKTEVLPHDK